ncbi:MAG: tRNA (adenosine(37)-N6)-dimethylallyltransferase MiaA [Alphaproteobacteria bacterium]|nr:tRNA (adenosine(37)-N6)-dimethylallyltransferase MiaA [Alphaproteobacteria bacterium]
MRKIWIIAGPTASGKSELGLRLAQRLGGCIVNADAMQVYRDLSVLTARPTEAEMQNVPHHLYGYLGRHAQSSAADWVARAVPVLQTERNPVVVGGTGLYLEALTRGFADIPAVDPAVRARVREMPVAEVHAQVKDCRFTDPQRMRRALEVQLSTGRTLDYFHRQKHHPPIEAVFQKILLLPPRDILYRQCAGRFCKMLEQGAVEEVRLLLDQKPTGGVLKAIGVPEITAYLDGEITKDEMIQRAILSTQHYAKRQSTWFRGRFGVDSVLESPADLDKI